MPLYKRFEVGFPKQTLLLISQNFDDGVSNELDVLNHRCSKYNVLSVETSKIWYLVNFSKTCSKYLSFAIDPFMVCVFVFTDLFFKHSSFSGQPAKAWYVWSNVWKGYAIPHHHERNESTWWLRGKELPQSGDLVTGCWFGHKAMPATPSNDTMEV